MEQPIRASSHYSAALALLTSCVHSWLLGMWWGDLQSGGRPLGERAEATIWNTAGKEPLGASTFHTSLD